MLHPPWNLPRRGSMTFTETPRDAGRGRAWEAAGAPRRSIPSFLPSFLPLAFLWIHWAKSLLHPDPAATPEDSHPNILNLIFSFLRLLQCSALPFCLQLERRTFLLRRRTQAIPTKEVSPRTGLQICLGPRGMIFCQVFQI